MKNTFSRYLLATSFIVLVCLTACDDFLDREPLDQVTPETYLNTDDQLATYAVSQYRFPTHGGWNGGTFTYDNHTDNQATSNASNRFKPGEWRVGQGGGDWTFGNIRQVNYFLEQVIPKYKNKQLKGNETNIEHYIGEVYFLRAYEYFNKLQSIGDFPIIRHTLVDQQEELVEASKRQPRNLVARFIISDLDSAIMLMNNSPIGGNNRLTKAAAQLLKSRVALYEGTWLKYHKGTAHVPGGPGWPGEDADYLNDFTIDIDAEVNYFLNQAKIAAADIIDVVDLTMSNHALQAPELWDNPYYDMFAANDMSVFDEVLFWRHYDVDAGVYHNTQHYLPNGGANTGYTKGFVEAFVMKNGLPIYDAASGYHGDATVNEVKIDRDERLQIFMKAKGELTRETDVEGVPHITNIPEQKYVTGYAIKKGVNKSEEQGGQSSWTGSIVFRATEAYLNYIEASYLLSGNIDATADACWRKIRMRAGINPDYNITISATDMSIESRGDWGAYSKGNLVDPVLFNIRRERRCELIAEGARHRDLCRWKSYDQVINYQIEGFNLWGGNMLDWYNNENGESILISEGTPGVAPNVSSPENSDYLRPYQIVKENNLVYNGYNWHKAHYLQPIAFEHFQLTSDGDPTNSVIYQNPYWPITPNGAPLD